MEIYQPAEDTHLLAETIEKELPKLVAKNQHLKYLEVGCGSGFLLEQASKFLDNRDIWSCDINPAAVKLCGEKGFNCVKSDLFSEIDGEFDLIVFNAPYLPLDEREPEDSRTATTGGKRGDEIAVRFLKEAKKHLAKDGKIWLLVSSLTPMDEINKFGGKVVAKKRVFTEDLIVLEFG